MNLKVLSKKLKSLKALWQNNKKAPLAVLFVALVILALLLYKNKNIFVVASVNGQPVWRWEMDQRLAERYGSQMLDEISSEMLIRQAAQSRGVSVSQAEISQKVDEITKSLNGKITLADALAQQGMTMAELRNQIELQALMEKMNPADIQVSDQEISDYLDKNKNYLTATDAAGMKEEAIKAITSSKKTQALQKFFSDLKSKAKISKYL